MKMAFRLARLETTHPTDAVLLLTEDTSLLAKLSTTLQPFPMVHRLAGGLLLVGSAIAPPGGVRLRRLGGDLYVPVDAQLLPRLLPDEIVGLTRDRGLVVLVNRALAFDPNTPLKPTEWLTTTNIRRAVWQPFPEPPDRPDRLSIIERPSPPNVAIEVLTSGHPEGTMPPPSHSPGAPIPEEARLPKGSVLGRVSAGMALGFAQAVTWFARQLNAPGLANWGGNLAKKALEKVPRLTEKVLGEQEAALREVLRQLQTGDIEKALKRAPIAVADPSQPQNIGTTADLSLRDPRFSLSDLVRSGEGSATWLGGGDVWGELARVYRQLAEESAKRGDVRRAAYLYGVLLRDVRSAANALMSGGYYRDAAILYRDKLQDSLAAAQAFERAGDFDEAVRLYKKREQYEEAAELLRRIGEEEQAIECFQRATEQLKNSGRWLEAGDLVRQKLGRQEAATAIYREGWKRGGQNYQACGERLLDDLLVTEQWASFDEVLAEAQTRFPPGSTTDAANFFNYALHIGAGRLPPDRREPVRDRVRLFYAEHLRRDATSLRQTNEKARELFAPKGGWTAPQLRDAEHATRLLAKRTPTKTTSNLKATSIHHTGRVSAVTTARKTHDLVMAINDQVMVWKCATGQRILVAQFPRESILVLSSNEDATVIHTLVASGPNTVHLRCYRAAPESSSHSMPAYLAMGQVALNNPDGDLADWFFPPQSCVIYGDTVVPLRSSTQWRTYQGLHLRETTKAPTTSGLREPRQFLLVNTFSDDAWEWDANSCRHFVSDTQRNRWTPTWEPGCRIENGWHHPMLDWVEPWKNLFRVAGITSSGLLHLTDFTDDDDTSTMSTTHLGLDRGKFDAVCFRGPNHLAAATSEGDIIWLSTSTNRLEPHARPTPLGVPSRVVSLSTGHTLSEVLAVLADGTVLRVQLP